MKNKKNKENEFKSKLFMRIAVVLTAVLIVAVGILCTSPSKAVEDTPYVLPTTEPETETETDRVTETQQLRDVETIPEIDGPDVTVSTDTKEPPQTEAETTGAETAAVTSEAVTTTAPPMVNTRSNSFRKRTRSAGRMHPDT
ncbi:MAG: hypothetical protein J5879_05140, partial [Clostridia bacterium]|nr:hypothetical protein [Clostridia bacterium]